MVSAAAPGEVGGDGDDRAVDVRQLADLDAVEGGKAGDGDQRVEHEGQDRPADEQRRDAGLAVGRCWPSVIMPGRAHEPLAATAASRRRPAGSRPAISTSAPSRTVWTPSVTTMSPAARSAVDQHGFGVALDDADRRALGLAVVDRPDEGAVGAPLDGQRVDRRVGVAGELHRDLERHAGAQRVVGVGDVGPHAQRAARFVEAVVDGADRALEDLARAGRSASR